MFRCDGSKSSNLYRIGGPILEIPERLHARAFYLGDDPTIPRKTVHGETSRLPGYAPRADSGEGLHIPQNGVQKYSNQEELCQVLGNHQNTSVSACIEPEDSIVLAP